MSSRSSRRCAAAVVALVALALLPLSGTAASAEDGQRRAEDGRRGPALTLDDVAPRVAPSGRITGIDGHTYESSPPAVLGKRGDYFLGAEFDYACAHGGPWLRKGMRQLGRLADVIEKSGRRVVVAVAPTKASVLPRRLPNKRLPHGRCSKEGIREQKVAVDRFAHPSYLPLRQRLLRDDREIYWKTDPHWTSVGGSVFSRALAYELAPWLGRVQKYTTTEASLLGLLAETLGIDLPEVAEAAVPASGVTVSPVPGQPSWVGWPYLLFDHSWTSSPASRTWRGQTLILGDSFGEFAMGNLRPLFHSGRYMWVGHVATADMVQAIVDSNTVVIEAYQLTVPDLELSQDKFRRLVRKALGVPR